MTVDVKPWAVRNPASRRWCFLEWPGSVRTTGGAHLGSWRSSGPPSSSLGWTAPYPATPTSTSTSCRPWPTSSTSTGGTWWWRLSPHRTTGKPEGVIVQSSFTTRGLMTATEQSDLSSFNAAIFFSSSLKRAHVCQQLLLFLFIKAIIFLSLKYL